MCRECVSLRGVSILECVFRRRDARGGEGGVVGVMHGSGESEVHDVNADAVHGVRHVLLIDDDALIRRVGARMLARMGYEVLSAASGSEGILMAVDSANSFTVIMLDLTMPDMDGVETFRMLRQRGVQTPVLLMSGLQEQEALKPFSAHDIEGYLAKPFTLSDLKTVFGNVFKE